MRNEEFEKAIQLFDGRPTELARYLNRPRSTVNGWRHRGTPVPEKDVMALCVRFPQLRAERLRPDIDWKMLRRLMAEFLHY